MKVKIQKTIIKCNDCEFSKIFQEKNGNINYAMLCYFEHEPDEQGDKEIHEPFLITTASESLKHFLIDIPDNCPLEDYENRT